MAIRDCWIPEPFIRAMCYEVPEFAKLDARTQTALAYMVWNSGTPRRAHAGYEGFDTYSYQELEQRFGRGRFAELNRRLKFFYVTPNWSKNQGETRGYRLSESMRRFRRTCLAGLISGSATLGAVRSGWLPVTAGSELVSLDGKRIATLPGALAALGSDGRKSVAWAGITLSNTVPVNLDSLHEASAALADRLKACPNQDHVKALEERLIAILQLITLANSRVAGVGRIPHRYVEAPSGRIYACGFTLQNAPRSIRQVALAGNYDYDIENCHYEILRQLGQRLGCKSEAIDAYLVYKPATRKGIAQRVGISEDQAKSCLLAIMYGARLSSYKDNAIPEEIGVAKARVLLQDVVFSAIARDVRNLREAVLSQYPKGDIENAMGKRTTGRCTSAQKLAHIIQGIEAMALRACVRYFGDDILLPVHDGFVSRKELNLELIEQVIYLETGFDLRVSCKQLSPSADLFLAKVKKAA